MLTALLPGCGLLYTVIFFNESNISEKQAWTDVNIRGLDPRMSDPSLAISATGVPFMLYWDGAYHFNLSVAKFEKDSWIPVGIQGFSSTNVFAASFALNVTGIPYVAYGNIINDDHKLWVMRLEGNAWVPVGLPIILGKSGGTFNSLALDTAGVPYVAYTEFDRNERKLLVMKFEGGIWIPVGSPIHSLRGAVSPSLALDAAGVLYLAYVDFDYDTKLSVVKLEGGTWVPVGPPSFSMKTDGYPSLALDAAGVPYVAYHGDRDNNFRLLVMKYEGDAWVFVGPPETSPKWISYPSMMLDAAGVPHVAYLNYGFSGFKFRMTKVEGGNWIPVDPLGFSPEKAEPPPSGQKE